MKRNRPAGLVVVVAALAAAAAFAGGWGDTGAPETGKGVIKSWNAKGRSGTLTTDSGRDLNVQSGYVDPNTVKVGDTAIFTSLQVAGSVVPVLMAVKAPAASSGGGGSSSSAPDPSAPTGTVKTFDPSTGRGTVTPSSGGRDLYFAVDPKSKDSIAVGSKVAYVEVMVTGLSK